MKEVLLFGISQLSERIAYYIDCGESVKPFAVKGFVIDDAYYKEETFAGRKVYRYSEAKENFLSDTAIKATRLLKRHGYYHLYRLQKHEREPQKNFPQAP